MRHRPRSPRTTAFALAAAVAALGPAAPATGDPGPNPAEPVLVTSIDTSAGGTGARLLLGDLTGDGRLDVITMQPTYSADDRYIGRQVQALTAYDLSGALLWQVGTPDPRVTNNGTDIPAEIYDIDADGDNDVLAVMDSELRIFDGATGQLSRAFPLPHPEAHDTIVIANLRGTPVPQDIVLKDRYNQVWALNSDGGQLWAHLGNPGHRPFPHDFDGDRRQELMAGYDLLDHDGTLLWTAPMADHADSIGVGDVDGDGREDIALGGAGLGGDSTNVYRSDGTLLWSNTDAVEAQQIGLGDFRPDLPGLELAGLDRVNRTTANGQDALYVVSSAGETLWKENRTTLGCWGTVMEPLHNWDGRYADQMLAWNRGCGEPAGIYDGTGRRVVTFPVDGRMMRGDVCGDDRTEVLDYVMGDRAYVYASAPCDLAAKVTGRPLPQSKRLYNYSRYTAEEVPADLAAHRRAYASSATGWRHRPAAGNDADPATRWVAARWDRHPRWQVDLGAIRELTGIKLDWGRTAPRAGYRVESSMDGRHWVPLVSRATGRETVEQARFTGLGRYVRITATWHQGTFGFADVQVLGTR